MGGGGILQTIFWIGCGGRGKGKIIFVTETLVKSA